MPKVSLEVSTNAPAEAQGLQAKSFLSEGTTATSAEGVSNEYRQVWFHLPDAAVPSVPPEPYAGNFIRTAKYTFYNFLVINLFEQFSRVANLYFLLIAVLQLVPGLSPTHWFTTVAPLLFVLLVNAVKEIFDDYYRHKSDDEVNNRMVDLLAKDGGWKKVCWKSLQVGDLVRIIRDEEVPADVVFLSSSDKDSLCYVETANLDGETNLKLKYSYGRPSLDTMEYIVNTEMLKGKFIECELPNEKLYQFEGSMVCSNDSKEVLGISNLILRGCTLRKTDWIVGAVVFAGIDTKIQCNQSSAPRKVTQLESHMNFLVIFVFFIQVVLAIAGAVGREIWLHHHRGDYYMTSVLKWPEIGKGFGGGAVTVLRFIILLNQLIPISLYVTLEVVKVVQCLFLNWDLAMYCKKEDTPFLCRTTTLNEDLGQVEYILSDKTGTLTQNVMGFVWASIGGTLFGTSSRIGSQRGTSSSMEIPPNTPHSIAFDADLRSAVQKHPGSKQAELQAQDVIDDFLLNLAICNTVVPATSPDGSLQYQAESPDEEALVQGAAYLGYKLISRSTEKIEIQMHNAETLLYTVLAVLEFSSGRKRMSILCRCPNGKIRLFCKGADTVIMKRLASNQPFLNGTNTHLSQMANSGFRTLLISHRNISEPYYKEWQQEFHLASVSLDNRESRVSKVAEKIEEELLLLGATAVEDKLQDGVPQAIASLGQAGIKIWVLTGDKLETAIVISRSCNLISEELEVVEIKESDVRAGRKSRNLRRKGLEIKEKSNSGVALVIEGGALAIALDPRYQDHFLEMCKQCKVVVCCRVSPIQKAQVANLVKQKAGAITLAIGDGANDVSMIQAAHIGVGISGREGRAAVLASDFAMCQFSFLARLLLVHGRWSYKRNSEVVLYAFYKNFAYCLANVYLNFAYAGFSSQPIYASAMIATYNLFWTSLPTIAFALLEQDITADVAMATPQLYKETMKETSKTFFCSLGWWLFEALWHSLLTFWLPIFALTSGEENGMMMGLNSAGVAVYTAVIITVNLKVAVQTQHWTIINAFTIFIISIGMWFPFVYICSSVWEWYGYFSNLSGVAKMLFSSPTFWLSAVFGAPVISILLDVVLISFNNRFIPRDSRIYQFYAIGLQEKEKCVSTLRGVKSSAPLNSSSNPPSQFQEIQSFTAPRLTH